MNLLLVRLIAFFTPEIVIPIKYGIVNWQNTLKGYY